MNSITRQWSFSYPNTSSANASSLKQCSFDPSTTGLNPIISGQYFLFKTISSYSANELITSLMNKMNPKLNPNYTYTDFHTNKCLFYSAVSRFMPYGPTEFTQWNIVIGMTQVIHFYDTNYFDVDSKILGLSKEKITCEILDNEEIAIREARALRYIFGNKCDAFNIYIENTENYIESTENKKKSYDELINIRNFEVTWNNSNESWKVNDLLSNPPRIIDINWFNIMIASRILNKPIWFLHEFITKLCGGILKKEIRVYTGKRHFRNRRKIYKTKIIALRPLPIELYYDIFIKFTKDEKFKGIYTEVFNNMGEDLFLFKGQ